MGRNHVHFAIGLPREDEVISGMPIVITLYLKCILRSNVIKSWHCKLFIGWQEWDLPVML